MKKAFLVDFSVRTRVIVDLDGKTKEEIDDAAIAAARQNILSDAGNYIIGDNCTGIEPDEECPVFDFSWDK